MSTTKARVEQLERTVGVVGVDLVALLVAARTGPPRPPPTLERIEAMWRSKNALARRLGAAWRRTLPQGQESDPQLAVEAPTQIVAPEEGNAR